MNVSAGLESNFPLSVKAPAAMMIPTTDEVGKAIRAADAEFAALSRSARSPASAEVKRPR